MIHGAQVHTKHSCWKRSNTATQFALALLTANPQCEVGHLALDILSDDSRHSLVMPSLGQSVYI